VIGGHEVALATLAVLDAPPPEIADVAAAAGFDSITLRLADASVADPNPLVGDTPTRRETIARLRHHGLGVLDIEVVRMGEDTDPVLLRPVLESARELGARHVLVINQDANEARAADRFARICEEAQAFELRPVLEFMVFTATKTVEQADRIVALASHPAAGVLVDPLHLSRSGGSPADVAPLVAANPDRYPYAQLCDGPRAMPGGGGRGLYEEAVYNRLAPGDGELPLLELIETMPAGAPLSVETPVAAVAHLSPRERAEHAMAATRRLLGE
jgi:sugar phosphate isomerase/epimerase